MLAAQRVIAAARRRLRGQLVDVRARDEGLVPRSRHDHDADGVVVLQREHRAAQLVERLRVERVEDFRPVDRDGRDGSVAFDQDVLERVEGHDERREYTPPCAGRGAQPTPSPRASRPTQSASTSKRSGVRPGTND